MPGEQEQAGDCADAGQVSALLGAEARVAHAGEAQQLLRGQEATLEIERGHARSRCGGVWQQAGGDYLQLPQQVRAQLFLRLQWKEQGIDQQGQHDRIVHRDPDPEQLAQDDFTLVGEIGEALRVDDHYADDEEHRADPRGAHQEGAAEEQQGGAEDA